MLRNYGAQSRHLSRDSILHTSRNGYNRCEGDIATPPTSQFRHQCSQYCSAPLLLLGSNVVRLVEAED